MRGKRWRPLLPALALLLLLSGCGLASADLDLTVSTGERYTWALKLSADQATMQMMGAQAFEQQIQQYVDEAKAQDANLSWRKVKADRADETAYELRGSGQGYDSLFDVLGIRIQEATYNGRQALRVVIPANTVSGLGATRSSITLHGAEILAGNGQKIDRGAMRWSPVRGAADAVLIPKGPTLSSGAIVIGGLLLLALAGIVLWRARAQRPAPAPAVTPAAWAPPAALPAPGSPTPIALPEADASETTTIVAKAEDPNRFCPFCGQPLAGPARFCLRCGREIPRRNS